MTTYRLLTHPGSSAVFHGESEALTLAELSLCLSTLSTPCSSPRLDHLAGVRYATFDGASPLPREDIAHLGRLSSLYALFIEENGLLRPIFVPRDAPFGEDLSGILKYTGKTNPLFTRLLLHLATLSLQKRPNRRIRLLDPVAGKGTTLFEGLMAGYDVSGIEILHKAAHEGAVYFQKYLETEKWKHTQKKEKSHGAYTWRFAFAKDKEGLKADPIHCTFVAGDAGQADTYFGKTAFDIIAGDLPYGVAHGSLSAHNLQRSPAALLGACLPALYRTLAPGGVLAFSWNTLVYPREEMIKTLAAHGFSCLTDPPYHELGHRVDASIRRDIIIGVKR